MSISIGSLKRIVQDFLRVLDEQKLTSVPELERAVNEGFSGRQGDVAVTNRPSNFGTRAITIRYILQREGIPVEIKINRELQYSQIVLKADERINGYRPFATDRFYNVAQNKVMKTTDFDEIKKELMALYQ